jgi:hypothetical protein
MTSKINHNLDIGEEGTEYILKLNGQQITSTSGEGSNSVQIGHETTANGNHGIAIGPFNSVSGSNTIAIGQMNAVPGNGSAAFGYNNTVSHPGSIVIESMLENTESNTILIGGDRQKTVVGDLDVNGTLKLNGEDLSAKIEELGTASSGDINVPLANKIEFENGKIYSHNIYSDKAFRVTDKNEDSTLSFESSSDKRSINFSTQEVRMHATTYVSLMPNETYPDVRVGGDTTDVDNTSLTVNGGQMITGDLAVDKITANEIEADNSYANNIQGGKKSNHLLLENQYGKITLGETVIRDSGIDKTVSNVKIETKPPN